jgi:hypothetical protein
MLNLFQYLFYHKDTKVNVDYYVVSWDIYNAPVIELTFISCTNFMLYYYLNN